MVTRADGSPARCSRRNLVAAGCLAASALAGCSRATQALAALGAPTRLRVTVLGFPQQVAAELAGALAACATQFGSVTLQVSETPVPPSDWYGQGVYSAGAGPASPVRLTTFEELSAWQTAGNLWVGGTPVFMARGRTRLGVKFGDGALGSPILPVTGAEFPDLILSYDLWQYWLTPLCADLGPSSKLYGWPAAATRAGEFYAAGHGTFQAALPVLRDPMVLAGAGPPSPQTPPAEWSEVAATFGTTRPNTSGFVVDPLYPEAAEAACAMVAAYGGAIGQVGPSSCEPQYGEPAAVGAITTLVSILARGSQVAAPGSPFGLRPSYLWDPLWGQRRRCWACISGVRPLPRGPARQATPCVYLCAWLPEGRPNFDATAAFVQFLTTAPGQTALGRWDGGLPIDRGAAIAYLSTNMPGVPEDARVQLADGTTDLFAAQLYGGPESDGNAAAWDGCIDGFVHALTAAETPPNVGGVPAALTGH